VFCDVTLTVAPIIADPDLSVTVPWKLPVACPNVLFPQQSRTTHAINAKIILLLISSPLVTTPTVEIPHSKLL
jgi:hypothetical protein